MVYPRSSNRRVSLVLVFGLGQWARSSAGEHLVDIEGVTGSIPVVPTILPGPGKRNRRVMRRTLMGPWFKPGFWRETMKVRNSLRSLKSRHRDCRVVRRKGRVYVINKTQRRFKARQG